MKYLILTLSLYACTGEYPPPITTTYPDAGPFVCTSYHLECNDLCPRTGCKCEWISECDEDDAGTQ